LWRAGRSGGGAGRPTPHGLVIDTVAAGLEVPWDIAFAPDGRIFLTERPGRIRVVEDGALRDEPWAELRVFGQHPDILPESGLLGIALAPDFTESGRVYVFATVSHIPGNRIARPLDAIARSVRSALGGGPDTRWESRVYRLTDQEGRGTGKELVVGGLPASYYHAGGALRFGPDGRMYLTTGDILESGLAQDPETLVGAVLRYESDGQIPADNPFPGSPVYAYGLRNPQGLAWHPDTGDLFATEHGPSFLAHEGGRHGKDEINVIVPGANYGWPVVAGEAEGADRFTMPLVVWTPAIAPPGLQFYTGSELPWRGNLLVTGLRGQQLRRLVLKSDPGLLIGWRVVEQEILFDGVFGRLRGIARGPDGHIYLTTSNRDGRGQPREGDDLLLRLRGMGAASAQTASECPP
jgi:aldose sugar dehydrogenase